MSKQKLHHGTRYMIPEGRTCKQSLNKRIEKLLGHRLTKAFNHFLNVKGLAYAYQIAELLGETMGTATTRNGRTYITFTEQVFDPTVRALALDIRLEYGEDLGVIELWLPSMEGELK